MAQIIDGAGRRREVQDVVDRAVDFDVIRDIVPQEREACVALQVLNVQRIAGDEIVDANDVVAFREEAFAEWGASR